MRGKQPPTWFGKPWGKYDQSDWDDAAAKGREVIIESWARTGGLGTYSDFADAVGILDWPTEGREWTDNYRQQVGRLLGDIGVAEWLDDRPVLASLVVRKDTKRPGMDWYRLMRTFGFTTRDDEKLWLDEVTRCWEFDW